MERPHGYLLDGHKPIPIYDLLTWARSYEHMNRRVKRTHVRGYDISTIFLGLDHNHWGGPPILFETLVFGKGELCTMPGSGRQLWTHETVDGERCETWEQAVKMHKRWLKLYRMSRRQRKRLDARAVTHFIRSMGDAQPS